jgi:hypothetical protein
LAYPETVIGISLWSGAIALTVLGGERAVEFAGGDQPDRARSGHDDIGINPPLLAGRVG